MIEECRNFVFTHKIYLGSKTILNLIRNLIQQLRFLFHYLKLFLAKLTLDHVFLTAQEKEKTLFHICHPLSI